MILMTISPHSSFLQQEMLQSVDEGDQVSRRSLISMEQGWKEWRRQSRQLHGPAHQMAHKTRQL